MFAKMIKNFTYKWVDSDVWNIGTDLGNGTFSGTIGMLQKNKGDISLVPTVLTPEYFEVVNYTSVVARNFIYMASGPPRPVENFTAYLSIFSLQSWLAIFFTMICVAMVCSFDDASDHTSTKTVFRSAWKKFLDVLVYFIGTVAKISIPLDFKSVGARVIFGIWMFCISSIMIGFSTYLQSFLVMSSKPTSINSFQDLMDNPDIRILTTSGGLAQERLESLSENDTVIGKLWSRIKSGNGLQSSKALMEDDILNEVYTWKSAIIGERLTLLDLVTTSCTLHRKQLSLGSAEYFDLLMVFPMRKDIDPAVYKKVEEVVSAVRNMGILEKHFNRLKFFSEMCTSHFQKKQNRMGFSEVKAVFYCWGLGMLFSVFVFGIEIAILQFRMKYYLHNFARYVHNIKRTDIKKYSERQKSSLLKIMNKAIKNCKVVIDRLTAKLKAIIRELIARAKDSFLYHRVVADLKHLRKIYHKHQAPKVQVHEIERKGFLQKIPSLSLFISMITALFTGLLLTLLHFLKISALGAALSKRLQLIMQKETIFAKMIRSSFAFISTVQCKLKNGISSVMFVMKNCLSRTYMRFEVLKEKTCTGLLQIKMFLRNAFRMCSAKLYQCFETIFKKYFLSNKVKEISLK